MTKRLIDTVQDPSEIKNPVLRDVFTTEKGLLEEQNGSEFEHHGNGHHGNSHHGNSHHGNSHHGNSHRAPSSRVGSLKIG